MKKPALLFLISLLTLQLHATGYYLSNSGNDNNAGTSAATPWKTIGRLNMATLAPGDTVYFNRGDIFRGNVSVAQSGTAASPIVFTAWGSGNNPVISGAELLTGWTLSGGIYAAPVGMTVRNFFVNDREQTIARYPNNGTYLWLDSAKTSYLKDADLTQSSGYWNGAKVCIHTAQWCWEKTGVSASIPGKLTFSSPVTLNALPGYAYFLYDRLDLLDTSNEWMYDSATAKVYYYPGAGDDPNAQTCEASVYSGGITLNSGVSYISITGITFEKQYQAGVAMQGSNTYVHISNCGFYRQYNYGVEVMGSYHHIETSQFREMDAHAIQVSNGGSTEIDHNTMSAIGLVRNNGIGGQSNGSAVKLAFTDHCHVHHNVVDSTGYCGISADGTYHVVERNILSHCMLINNDGAPLKSFGSGSSNNTFSNNFVSNSPGNTEGTVNANFVTPGIYFDFYVNNSTVKDNTLYDQTPKGIFMNSGTPNNTITGNVVYGAAWGLDLNGNPLTGNAITGDVIKKNVYFAFQATDVLMRQVDFTNSFNYGVLDSNYYFHPYAGNRHVLRMNGTTPHYWGWSDYQANAGGQDAHSKPGFVSWTYPYNGSRLFMNQTDDPMTISLGDSLWLDLDSNQVCGSLTLQPFTSKVLIFNAVSVEVCDGADNNCNGQVDEGLLTAYYADADGDGFGNGDMVSNACSQPAGYVTNSLDCNDGNAGVHPGAVDVCDGVDNDCDGVDNCADCVAPGGNAVALQSSSSVIVLWDAVPGAIKYNLYYRLSGAASWTSKTTTRTYYELTGLNTPSTYEYKLRTYCADSSWTDWGAVSTFSTSSGAAPCSKPTLAGSVHISSTSEKAYWSIVQNAVKYQVRYRPSDLSTAYEAVSTSNPYRIFSGLQPNTEYQWQVRVKCSSSTYSAWSSLKFFTTEAGSSLVDTDVSVSLRSVGDSVAAVFPNPASDHLSLRADETPRQIGLYDTRGQFIRRLDTQGMAWDISDLSAGMYWVILEEADGRMRGLSFLKQ